jgi:hypothetical protein
VTHAEYVAKHGREPHDEQYWGPDGVQVAAKWGDCWHMRRGCDYHVNGVDVGGPGQVRKISTGRKARGMASDAYERSLR